MNKKIILPAVAFIIIGTAVMGVANAQAEGSGWGQDSLIQKLVQKFNLREADVKAVFDEARGEQQAKMKTNFEDRLTQAVKDGKVTEEQKKLILGKHNEMAIKREQNRDQFQNMTNEERKTAMQAQRQELEDWAKENNIDLQYFFGHGGSGGRKGGWGMK